MTPRAVPKAAVAKLPVLQCVNTLSGGCLPLADAASIKAAAPAIPMALFAAISSSNMCSHALMIVVTTD